jgi:hypothetical protein
MSAIMRAADASFVIARARATTSPDGVIATSFVNVPPMSMPMVCDARGAVEIVIR